MNFIIDKILSHKEWRKLVKKQQRKRRRAATANLVQCLKNEELSLLKDDPGYKEKLKETERLQLQAKLIETAMIDKQREAWMKRNVEDHKKFLMKKQEHQSQEMKMSIISNKQGNRTRQEKIIGKPLHTLESSKIVREAQNPEPPKGYIKETRNADPCPFFIKTGACRFGPMCSREHMYPNKSRTILFTNMYTNIGIQEELIDDLDSDLALEYSEIEILQHFRDFYFDVLEEFTKFGNVVQLKVCCNKSPHLRGNVYVQYEKEDSAIKSISSLNGRWYAGRQLSCQFCPIEQWKYAICGLFWSKRCPKGDQCNFLHVYRNPGNAFNVTDRSSMIRHSRKCEYHRASSRESCEKSKVRTSNKHKHSSPRKKVHSSKSNKYIRRETDNHSKQRSSRKHHSLLRKDIHNSLTPIRRCDGSKHYDSEIQSLSDR